MDKMTCRNVKDVEISNLLSVFSTLFQMTVLFYAWGIFPWTK